MRCVHCVYVAIAQCSLFNTHCVHSVHCDNAPHPALIDGGHLNCNRFRRVLIIIIEVDAMANLKCKSRTEVADGFAERRWRRDE